MTLAIVDIGGNTGSIRIALERLGVTPIVTGDPAAITAAERVLLPGVGAAGRGMAEIARRGLTETLRALRQPLLGICLGMQLLFQYSEEDDVAGLGILPGRVRRLTPAPDRPVPHMGWSALDVRDNGLGLADGDYVYFAHSYACDDGTATVATADYGRAIPAAVRLGNVWGAQFHPERSGPAGSRFLAAFLA